MEKQNDSLIKRILRGLAYAMIMFLVIAIVRVISFAVFSGGDFNKYDNYSPPPAPTETVYNMSDPKFRDNYISNCGASARAEGQIPEGFDEDIYCGCVHDRALAVMTREEFIDANIEIDTMMNRGDDETTSALYPYVEQCISNQI